MGRRLLHFNHLRPLLRFHAGGRRSFRSVMQHINDEHFDPKAQLLTLSESEAIEYAHRFLDEHCERKDAAYLSEVITAGEKSPEVTYDHAMGGSAVAQLVYGSAKLHGTHTEQSISEGLFWLMRSFNNGNAKAAIVLAGTYMQGTYVARNPSKALTYARHAADQGLPAGQFVLANLLIGGEGIPEDEEQAIELLQSAARSGYAAALKMLQDNGISLE
jgi:TPR repeat protein